MITVKKGGFMGAMATVEIKYSTELGTERTAEITVKDGSVNQPATGDIPISWMPKYLAALALANDIASWNVRIEGINS